MYVKVNVPKPGDNKGVGGDKKDTIILFDFDDLLSFPARDLKGIIMPGNIAMNPGAYMIKFYATQSSIKISQGVEGDPDAKGVIQTLEIAHPGSDDAIEEFLQNWQNKNIGAIVQSCSTNKKRLLGTPCAPLQLTADSVDDKDANKSTITLKSTQKGPRVANYQGTIPFDAVTGTIGADEVDIDVADGEGQYQLTVGTSAAAAIATVSNPVDGMLFTLLGSGGTYPSTIPAGAVFILKDGTTWTANDGSAITFKVFKNGAASYACIEQSRI